MLFLSALDEQQHSDDHANSMALFTSLTNGKLTSLDFGGTHFSGVLPAGGQAVDCCYTLASSSSYCSQNTSNAILEQHEGATCPGATAQRYIFKEEREEYTPVISMSPTKCGLCGTKISEVCKSFFLIGQQSWHTHCARCCVCGEHLATTPTCFHRDGLFKFINRSCERCCHAIGVGEIVMHATRDKVFHLNCFNCALCAQALRPGDTYFLGAQPGAIFCQSHYDMMIPLGDIESPPAPTTESRTSKKRSVFNKEVESDHMSMPAMETDLCEEGHMSADCSPSSCKGAILNHTSSSNSLKLDSSSAANSCYGGECGGAGEDDTFSVNGSSKAKRLRTSFKHHQLRTMKTYFNLNHNPDAKDLKQLAQKTGLTKRVLQVWFQNARAKYRRFLPTNVHLGSRPVSKNSMECTEEDCNSSSNVTVSSISV
uniref:Uncharacterized protein n=1 Tax=Ditylenchus dipsaci TaxID=166011 RepID=A0A915EQE4_9BILA